MTAIKTEEERARLDELYALVEAEMDHSAGSGEMPEKAEAGKGQEPFDNHHYYKIFADSVRKLADKLQGVADVEN